MNVLRTGHPDRKKLDAVQSQIAALKKELASVESAPLSMAETHERLRTALARQVESDDPGYRLRAFRQRTDPRYGRAAPPLPDISWGLLALVVGGLDELLNRLLPPITADDAQRPGLTEADRGKRLAELGAKLADSERREELLILELEEQRWDVIRRGDADPRLLLEIWAAHRPETLPDAPAAPVGAERRPHLNEGAALHAPPQT